jgi:hypothetical protein
MQSSAAMAAQGESGQSVPRGIRSPAAAPPMMSSRQRAVLEGLINFGPKDGPWQLGPIYEGTLLRLADTGATDGAAYAAHGARELMEKLGWRINDDTPEERGSLGDRAEEIETAHAAAVGALPPERALWAGVELAPEVVALMDAVAHMARWRQGKTLSRSSHASLMVEFSIGRIPRPLQAEKRRQLMDLRDFFDKVSHHGTIDGRQQTLDDVAGRFGELEDFLYARWAPQTVRDFAEIDALIAPREDG